MQVFRCRSFDEGLSMQVINSVGDPRKGPFTNPLNTASKQHQALTPARFNCSVGGQDQLLVTLGDGAMKTIVYRRLMLLVPVAVLILLLSITSALPVHAQGCQQGGPEGGGPGGFGGMGPGGGGGMGPGGGNFPPPGLTGGGGMYPPPRRGGGLGMGPPPGPPGGGGMGGGMGNGMGNGMGPGFGQGGYGSAGMFPHFGPGGGGPGMSDEDEGGPGMTAPGDGGPGMFPHFGPGGGGPGMSALDRTGRGMGSGSAGGMCPAHMGGGRGVFPPSPPPMATGRADGLAHGQRCSN